MNPDSIDPSSRTVRDDVSCFVCGYNLRSLSVEGACPECGLAVRKSLSPVPLCRAGLAWLKRARRAAQLLVLGSCGPVACYLLAFPLGGLARKLVGQSLTLLLFIVVMSISCGAYLVGTYWILAPPDYEVKRKRARIVRAATLAVAALLGGVLLDVLLHPYGTGILGRWSSAPFPFLHVYVSAPCAQLVALEITACIRHRAREAKRPRVEHLAKTSSRMLAVLVLITSFLVTSSVYGVPWGWSAMGSRAHSVEVLMTIVCANMVYAFVCLVVWLVLLVGYGRMVESIIESVIGTRKRGQVAETRVAGE